MRKYLSVNVKGLPDIYEIYLAGATFTLRFDYNDVTDFYMVTIWDNDNNLLLNQQPLIMNELIGYDLPDKRLPRTDLRVMDESGQAKWAGKGDFGVSVQIYLDVIDPNGSETGDPTIKPFGYDPDESTDNYTDEEVSS